MPFVGPIKKGVELLTGTADTTSLEIGILREYDPPVTGWYALVRVPGGSVKPGELSVSPGNFELLRNGKTGARGSLPPVLHRSRAHPS